MLAAFFTVLTWKMVLYVGVLLLLGWRLRRSEQASVALQVELGSTRESLKAALAQVEQQNGAVGVLQKAASAASARAADAEARAATLRAKAEQLARDFMAGNAPQDPDKAIQWAAERAQELAGGWR